MHLGTTNGLYGHPGGLLEVSRLLHFQSVCTLLGKDRLQLGTCRNTCTASCAADRLGFCKIRLRGSSQRKAVFTVVRPKKSQIFQLDKRSLFKNEKIDLVAFKGKLRVGRSKLRPECHVNGDAPIFSRRTPKLALETSTARFLIEDERNRS